MRKLARYAFLFTLPAVPGDAFKFEANRSSVTFLKVVVCGSCSKGQVQDVIRHDNLFDVEGSSSVFRLTSVVKRDVSC